MIDRRFSAEAFSTCGLDTQAAEKLAQELASEIRSEVHDNIVPRITAIIDQLNDMGHNLKPYGEISPGDIAYRDDVESASEYLCKLRVGLDFIVSVGYSHLTHEDEQEP